MSLKACCTESRELCGRVLSLVIGLTHDIADLLSQSRPDPEMRFLPTGYRFRPRFSESMITQLKVMAAKKRA